MSREQGAVYSTQRGASCEQEESEFCSIHQVVNEPLEIRSATGNTLRRFLGELFRCHPVSTAVLILLLLVLVLALGAAVAVLAAPQVPVTPATSQSFLGCPQGWVGYNEVCYYFSRAYSTWDQDQERCSELNASLAIAKDEEAMDLLSRLCGNFGYWLGLRRRGERLHWGDGSSYSSR
ncbi:C-type lectin domain family 2 member D11-like [Ammospiza maritima maritima]